MRKKNFLKTDRSSQAARWKKLFVAAGILLCTYLSATFILGEMGLVKYYRMRDQYTTLKDAISALKQDNVRLRRDIYSLKNDTAYLERVARDKLGLARPGEIVYYYDDTNEMIRSANPK